MQKKIIHWLKRQVKAAGAKGVVLGLSGGLDSCVVAVSGKEGAGRKECSGAYAAVSQPGSGFADAKLVARKFGIKTKNIDLSKIYDGMIGYPARG